VKKLYSDPVLVYEHLIDQELFTQEELDLATNLNGFNMETLNDCLYVRFGYRSLEQMLDEDPD
jgi:hypothetical protein